MPIQQTDASQILRDHVNVGPRKPVSFLPLKTIANVIGITVDTYKSLVEQSGNRCAVFGPDECCIQSGAAYAYSEIGLNRVLLDNASVLRGHDWPTAPEEFLKRLASVWLRDDDPMLSVIREAFGEVR